jgi:hypothetical protein
MEGKELLYRKGTFGKNWVEGACSVEMWDRRKERK